MVSHVTNKKQRCRVPEQRHAESEERLVIHRVEYACQATVQPHHGEPEQYQQVGAQTEMTRVGGFTSQAPQVDPQHTVSVYGGSRSILLHGGLQIRHLLNQISFSLPVTKQSKLNEPETDITWDYSKCNNIDLKIFQSVKVISAKVLFFVY